MPCAGSEILDCLIRYKSRQILFFAARKSVLHFQILRHTRELSRVAQRQAEEGGTVAAWAVTREFRTVGLLLTALDRAGCELRTCDGGRRYFASVLLGWGDA